jgi:hypothetical protein
LQDSPGFVLVFDVIFVKRLTIGQYFFIEGHKKVKSETAAGVQSRSLSLVLYNKN